jgi:hypothetical protein
MLFIAVSCKKQSKDCGCMGAAPPLLYEVVDKSGKNILDTNNSAKDSLTLIHGGQALYDPIINGNAATSGITGSGFSQAYQKYDGMVVFDFNMLQANSPIANYNFDLSYHGQKLGTIYFKYWRWNHSKTSSWQEAEVFTFNNALVKMDTTGGRHLYVIQLQQ